MGGAVLTSSSSGGSRGPSCVLSTRTGARGRSRSLLSAPSAAPTSRASPSPSAPRSAGSSVLTCRTCGGGDRGEPLAHPAQSCGAQALTFWRFSARWPRPSRPSQRTVGSGSLCQALSRSRMTSSRRSRAVGQLCNSWAGDTWSGRSRPRCWWHRLRAAYRVPPHHPPRTKAHPGEEGYSREALRVVGAAQPGQQVSEEASQVVVRVGHHGTGTGPDGSSPSAHGLTPGEVPTRPPSCPGPFPAHSPGPHLASSRTPSRWVWAPTSLLQPPACSMHVTTIRLPSPVSRAFRASTVQLGVGAVGVSAGRALTQPSAPPVCDPHLAWLCSGPWWDGVHTLEVLGERAPRASSCSCVTSTRSRCG